VRSTSFVAGDVLADVAFDMFNPAMSE